MRANDIIQQENLNIKDVIFIDGNNYHKLHKVPNKLITDYLVVPDVEDNKTKIYIY